MAPREVYSIKKPWFREARSSRWRQKPRHFLGSGVKCVRLKTSASCVVFNRRDAPTPCNAASGAAAGENGAQELNVGLGGVWGVRQGWVRTSESWSAPAPAPGLQSPGPAFSSLSFKDRVLNAQGHPRVAASVRPVHPASGGASPARIRAREHCRPAGPAANP